MGWKIISRHRAFQKGVCLLRTKSRDNVTVRRAARLPDRPGRVNSFPRLVADFYNLQTKKNPAGGLVLGDWLGQCTVVCVRAKSLQVCATFCDPMNCSPPGSSLMGILWARILEWVAMPSSRGSP